MPHDSRHSNEFETDAISRPPAHERRPAGSPDDPLHEPAMPCEHGKSANAEACWGLRSTYGGPLLIDHLIVYL